MTTDQLSSLTTAQVQALTSADLNVLSSAKLGALTTTEVRALTTAQIAALSTDALKQPDLNATDGINDRTSTGPEYRRPECAERLDLGTLTSTEVRALTTAQIAALSTDALNNLTSSPAAITDDCAGSGPEHR